MFFYTLIGGTCAAFGIFYFFASILEFAEHYFFYADEFMAIAITMALCGIWIGSKTIWVAHNVGHNAEALNDNNAMKSQTKNQQITYNLK